MQKASVIRSKSTPHTEIPIEDAHGSLRKTYAVEFEHPYKSMNSIGDEKLEVQWLQFLNIFHVFYIMLSQLCTYSSNSLVHLFSTGIY